MSVWQSVVKAVAKAGDTMVEIAAIAGLTVMAVEGVELATLQAVGAMVVSVAIGKRYFEHRHDETGGVER